MDQPLNLRKVLNMEKFLSFFCRCICIMYVEHMALVNETEILNYTKLKSRPLRHNMTSAEFTAKQVLAKDNSIVIKKADKGSAVVIQNR